MIEDIRHKDGIPWHEAPLPPKKHDCWVQSSGWIGFNQYLRCACGARRLNREGKWFDKNSRSEYEEEQMKNHGDYDEDDVHSWTVTLIFVLILVVIGVVVGVVII